ncbi:hypothetical protein C8Q70DRAFT_1059572 [Cubamyces menziesii]|nr:hypothetical protein C8Q70DRAFT_1059572 [Cubamyces menziesii]
MQGAPADHGRSSDGSLADVGKAFLETHGLPESHLESHHLMRQEIYTRPEKEKAFSDIASIVKEYSKELVDRWGSEIETYLAGLFSAILTAFNVESYQLLQSPSPDSSAAILERISLQISSLSYSPPFVNSTHSAFDSSRAANSAEPDPVPRWAIWLNMLWFSSLVLSLSSASVGILVKQWLNEFQSGLSGDSERVAKLRQYRFNNLKYCHIGAIVNAIPVLLQAALSLFFAGLLVLLWNLNRAVAAVTSLFVLAIAMFIIGTTIAPLVTPTCAYLSPQSLFLYTAWPYAVCAIYKPLCATRAWLCSLLGEALPRDNIHTKHKASFQSWVGREHETVGEMSQKLEVDMCRTAYRATLHNDVIVSATVRVFDWDVDSAFAWLSQLQDIDISHFGMLQDHLQGGQAVTEAVFYGYILLCSMVNPSIVHEPFFTRSGLTPEEVERRFHNCFESLKSYAPSASDERHDRWARQVSWILTTYAVLYERNKDQNQLDVQGPPPFPTCIAELTSPLESPRLVLMAMIVGTGSAQLEHQHLLLLKLSGIYASIAFQELQSSASSRKTSNEYLRTYLRTQALLLYAVAIRPPRRNGSLLDQNEHESEDERKREKEREDFDNGVKDALADLNECFRRLARPTGLAGTRRHIVAARLGVFLQQRAIIGPLSHIVRTLSLKADVFRLVLPGDFVANLEEFVGGMERSGFFEQRFWTHVPWNEGRRWYPRDLYDATQGLIAKLRNTARRDGSTPQYVFYN